MRIARVIKQPEVSKITYQRRALIQLYHTAAIFCACLASLPSFSLATPRGGTTWSRAIQPKFRPVRPGKEDHLKRWTCFFETFPVGPNRSIEFWTEIFGNFGWMDRAQSFCVWLRWPIKARLPPLVTNPVPKGQHSLTSVERRSYLRSDFVNVWRHARLEVQYVIHLHSDLFDFCWEILSHFLDHSSIDSNQFKQEDVTASV